MMNAHNKRALKPENRFRKNSGLHYYTHPLAVKQIAVKKVDEIFSGSIVNHYRLIVAAIALLHDVLEDTNVTIDELEKFLSEMLPSSDVDLILIGFKLLTKDKENFDIIKYLTNIKQVLLAANIVKQADLEHNMSDLKPGNLLDKYKLCYYFLTQ